MGIGILGFFILIASILLAQFVSAPQFPLPPKKALKPKNLPALASLQSKDMQSCKTLFSLSSLDQAFLLSLCPKRPGSPSTKRVVQIQIKPSKQLQELFLPGSIGLSFCTDAM